MAATMFNSAMAQKYEFKTSKYKYEGEDGAYTIENNYIIIIDLDNKKLIIPKKYSQRIFSISSDIKVEKFTNTKLISYRFSANEEGQEEGVNVIITIDESKKKLDEIDITDGYSFSEWFYGKATELKE